MLEHLELLEKRYEEVQRMMAQPEVARDPVAIRRYAQEQGELAEVVETYRHRRRLARELAATQAMRQEQMDQEMEALVEEEIGSLQDELDSLDHKLRQLLAPKDPHDEKDVIVEIRAGTGGEEAALFAADLYRMYTRYAENHGWGPRFLSASPTGVGGFKEVIFEVKGKGAYSQLKFESGVHRVQRVPMTESGGRIHTSTATVAVLPEMEEVEVEIDPDDLRIDVFRSSGHGGQSVNTTDSAVRITHLPTALVVSCQDERSQLQNRQRAMVILRARLYNLARREREAQISQDRRRQVGTGERSEKIRTYNFPQNRVTDHRLGYSSHQLERVLAGELDGFIDQLAAREQAERLRALGEERA